jgi:uncharacterized protein YjbI with pentapeptide repeats
MTTLHQTSPLPPPNWPSPPDSGRCDQPWSTDPTRQCIALPVDDSGRCLAYHPNRNELLIKQAREGTIDLSDAEVGADLGNELRKILRNCGPVKLNAAFATFCGDYFSPDSEGPVVFLGSVNFGSATFLQHSRFSDAAFHGESNFGGTKFRRATSFKDTHFYGVTGFGDARFAGVARFEGTVLDQGAAFGGATFSDICYFSGVKFGLAEFKKVRFEGLTYFQGGEFRDNATFEYSEFLSQVSFRGSDFEGEANFGFVKFGDRARFDQTTFSLGVSFEEATFRVAVSFDEAKFNCPVEFKRTTLAPQMFLGLRPKSESLNFDAVRLVGPTELAVEHAQLSLKNVGLVEHLTIKGTPGSGSESFLVELKNSTIAKPVTIGEGVSLRDTSFLGTTGLDLVRVADAQWQTAKETGRRWPQRSRNARKILADESKIVTTETDPEKLRKDYVAVEGLYRQFRSGLEASKAAPAAADFYYGEMEMRRLAASPKSFEKILLWCYKWIGGYGVRASRPFAAWFGLILFSATTLRIGSVHFVDRAEPKPLPLGRFGNAIILVLHNSVNLFSAPTSGLTPWGTFFMIVERAAAIALFSLGVFALRSRVQR